MNGNQLFITQWSKPHMKQALPFSDVQKPYEFYKDSVQRLGNSYQSVTGQKWNGPEIMVTGHGMLGKTRGDIYKKNDADHNRFASEKAKLQKEMIYKGLHDWSRFYSKKKVTPETIAADIGASAFEHTRNSVPTGDSPQVNGMEVTARSTEQIAQKDKPNSERGLSSNEYVAHPLMRPIENVNKQKLTEKNYDSFL